tara:strand:+ start:1148 stop:1819 length:672 start_codon:yes stop_codon:yes gene_type:complete
MNIFLDTADCQQIQKYYGTGLIDGVTTNPSLIMKSHRKPDDVYQELKDMGLTDISMEVVADSVIDTLREAHRLYELFGDVTTIKVPCTPDGLQACHELAKENIRVNVTLIFSQVQAILAAKAGAAYVSPFVGRVDDNSFGGLCLVKDIAKVFREHMVRTQVLAASLRGVRDVGRAFEYGADIVTMPVGVFEKCYNHILTDKGLELFNNDWQSVQALNENPSLV